MLKRRIRSSSLNKLIIGLQNHLNFSIQNSETRYAFCKRLLLSVSQNLSMREIADICNLGVSIIFRAYKEYHIKAVPASEHYLRFSKKRALATRKYAPKKEDMRKYHSGFRKYNPDEVRNMMMEHKDIGYVAEKLNAPRSSIQDLIQRHRKTNPDWLVYRCQFCFKQFIPKTTIQIYCSKKCNINRQNYFKAFSKHGFVQKHKGDMIVCEECGQEVKRIETRQDYNRKYCQICRKKVTQRIQRDCYQRKVDRTSKIS